MVQRSKVFLTLCTPKASPSAGPAHKAWTSMTRFHL
jgi:hypothetical protein